MSISVDNVYQQVLAIANKEQRGYITPQEFNLFARKAQIDVFENTFAAYKDAYLHPEQVVGQHNDLMMLREKMQPFRVIGANIVMDNSTLKGIVGSDNSALDSSLGGIGKLRNADNSDDLNDIHWIESVYDFTNEIVFKEVTKRDVMYMMDYRLHKGFPASIEHIAYEGGDQSTLAFKTHNVFYRHSADELFFYPVNVNNAGNGVASFAPKADYVRKLSSFDQPKWAYVVANNKALYNSSLAKPFVLHESEESSLVNRILELAGIAIDKVPLADMALRNEALNKTQQAGPPSPAPQRR